MGFPISETLTRFAAETGHSAEKASALDTLGIDPRQLVFQIIAFGILVGVLTKWVFPVLIKAVDERQARIEESLKAAQEAESKSAEAQDQIEELLKTARKESADIVATAHKEAVAMVEDAESKAQKKAEHIVSEAKAQLDTEILKARSLLAKETKLLVAEATEKIIAQKLTGALDEKLIEQALKESK